MVFCGEKMSRADLFRTEDEVRRGMKRRGRTCFASRFVPKEETIAARHVRQELKRAEVIASLEAIQQTGKVKDLITIRWPWFGKNRQAEEAWMALYRPLGVFLPDRERERQIMAAIPAAIEAVSLHGRFFV